MRWINRGPEPPGVDGYARHFTPGWIDYFRRQRGGRPTDSYWREFRAALGARSANVCWYCERRCEPASEVSGKAATVDHFKPLSRFPELAYEWTNWIFSCAECNGEFKRDKWPSAGYVDPSTDNAQEGPEKYFHYDMLTGEIIAHPSLAGDARKRAWDTITDLGLNRLNVLFYRLDWTRRLVADLHMLPVEARADFVNYALGQTIEYIGSTVMVVAELRATGEI